MKKENTYEYYATVPWATALLLRHQSFRENVWECACGGNHITEELIKRGYNVRCSDIIQRCEGVEKLDFLSEENNQHWDGDIVTNPPFSLADKFLEKAMSLVDDGAQICFLLPLHYPCSISRNDLLDKYPIRDILVSDKRMYCAENGEFEKYKSGTENYAWFIWEKGHTGITRFIRMRHSCLQMN